MPQPYTAAAAASWQNYVDIPNQSEAHWIPHYTLVAPLERWPVTVMPLLLVSQKPCLQGYVQDRVSTQWFTAATFWLTLVQTSLESEDSKLS